MYAIYGNIYHQYTPNVSIYTIHGYESVSPRDMTSGQFAAEGQNVTLHILRIGENHLQKATKGHRLPRPCQIGRKEGTAIMDQMVIYSDLMGY